MLFYEPGCNDAKLDLQNYANSNLTFSLFTYRLIRVGLPKTGVSWYVHPATKLQLQFLKAGP